MERVTQIWMHPVYQEHLHKTLESEKDRIFCKHTPEHFLDTARLCYIFSLESGLKIPKDIIYAAALLHDVGRHLQYGEGIPHEKASAQVAETVLPECGYTEAERKQILEAILNHRTRGDDEDFAGIFYRADKASRSCFLCPAERECNWPAEKKNLKIKY